MKQFDTALAQLGDRVIVRQPPSHQDVPARYLAQMEDGRHVVELVAVSGTHFVNVVDACYIYAPPRKRTVWINLHRQRDSGIVMPYAYDDEAEAKERAGNSMNIVGTYPCEFME